MTYEDNLKSWEKVWSNTEYGLQNTVAGGRLESGSSPETAALRRRYWQGALEWCKIKLFPPCSCQFNLLSIQSYPTAPLKLQTMFSFQHWHTNESGTTDALHTATPLPSTGIVCYSGCNVCISWDAFLQAPHFARQSHWLCSLRQRTVAVASQHARFKAHQGRGCVSLVSVVWCQQGSLQRADHSSRGVLPNSMCLACNHEASTTRRHWPTSTRGCQTIKKKSLCLFYFNCCALWTDHSKHGLFLCVHLQWLWKTTTLVCPYSKHKSKSKHSFHQNRKLQVPTPLFILCYVYSIQLLFCFTVMSLLC
jgi:hypothetical protein